MTNISRCVSSFAMVEQPYLSPGLPHPDILSDPTTMPDGSRASSTPTTSAYPDLSPYPSVPSFNLPTQCDSSLLTPTSSAGSPPLHQGRKLVRQYPAADTTHTQEPSPPATARMYQHWNSSFDMDNSQPSSVSSPMTTQAHTTLDFYMPDERRTPGPPDPYLGAFGVSESNPNYYHGMTSMDNQNAMMMRDSPPMALESHHREMERINPASLLNQPHHPHFTDSRRGSTDGSAMHSAEAHCSASGSPRRRSVATVNGRITKNTKKSNKRAQAAIRNGAVIADVSDEHKNSYGEEVPPTLKDTCPDEERCIFDSRWKHRYQRGQDMWESIQGDFERAFNKTHGKEMLQMKFKRGRSKYIEWLPKDEEILRQAWIRLEKERYRYLVEIFHEMGGSRNMLLSASDVEVKVVTDLRLEDGLYMDSIQDPEIRPRRKVVSKKRPSNRGCNDEMPLGDRMMSMGSHNMLMEDDVINQVHGRRDGQWDENSSSHSDMMDVNMWDSGVSIKMEAHNSTDGADMNSRNEQVARQACVQILKANGNTANGAGRSISHRRKGS